MNYRQS